MKQTIEIVHCDICKSLLKIDEDRYTEVHLILPEGRKGYELCQSCLQRLRDFLEAPAMKLMN